MKAIATVLPAALLLAFSGLVQRTDAESIEIRSDPAPAGILEEYRPARLDIEFSPSSSGPPVRSLTLVFGQKETRLPSCITSVLRSTASDAVQANSFWDRGQSPPRYLLALTLYDHPIRDLEPPLSIPQYCLTFNLETGRLIEMLRSTVDMRARRVHAKSVDLTTLCGTEELSEILGASQPSGQ
jgi:hypothetical protein